MENTNMISDTVGVESRALLMGCACVVRSMLTPEQIEKFCIYHPDALIMKNEDGEEIFRIDLDETIPGHITRESAVFSKVTTAEGKATITVLIDPECENRKAAVLDTVGPGLHRLDEIEPKLVALLPELAKEEEKAWEMFTQL